MSSSDRGNGLIILAIMLFIATLFVMEFSCGTKPREFRVGAVVRVKLTGQKATVIGYGFNRRQNKCRVSTKDGGYQTVWFRDFEIECIVSGMKSIRPAQRKGSGR